MWELAANWHRQKKKKKTQKKNTKKKHKKNTHKKNICQATAKNGYFGIIYNDQGRGGGLGGGTSREGGGADRGGAGERRIGVLGTDRGRAGNH